MKELDVMMESAKRTLDICLWDMALVRNGERIRLGDTTWVDDYIATKGAEIFEEADKMDEFETIYRMIKRMTEEEK